MVVLAAGRVVLPGGDFDGFAGLVGAGRVAFGGAVRVVLDAGGGLDSDAAEVVVGDARSAAGSSRLAPIARSRAPVPITDRTPRSGCRTRRSSPSSVAT